MIDADTNQLDLGDYLHSIDAEPQHFGVVIMERLMDQSYRLTITWHFATRLEAQSFIDENLFPFYLENQHWIVLEGEWQAGIAQLREHCKKTNMALQVLEYDRVTHRYYRQILP